MVDRVNPLHCCKCRIHAAGEGFEHCTSPRWGPFVVLFAGPFEVERTNKSVDVQQAAAWKHRTVSRKTKITDKLGEPARSQMADEVHQGEAVCRHQVAERSIQVGLFGRVNVGHSALVTNNFHLAAHSR
ncbi:hypothetical protein HRbin30_03236 [bacterium HR30]|nr:hypothetical protein HRbin30_03236 [bacterium HR30]